MPAGHRGRVVLVGQHPVDLLRQPARHRRREHAAGRQHADHLRQRAGVVGHVLEHLRRDDRVEGAVGERQPRGVAAQHADEPLGRDLAGLDHRRQGVARAGHLVGGDVEGGDAHPLAGELEGVAAEAGADVEHAAPRPQAEVRQAAGADRQHPAPRLRRSLSRLAGIASTSRYCSTVCSAHLPPRPALEDALAPGRADTGAQLGVVQAARDGGGQRSGVAGPARQHRLAVATGHLRQRPAVGRHQCGAGDHRLDRRQAEPLVQARDDGELGLGVQLDDASSVTPETKWTCVAEPERADEVHALAVLRLADDRQRDVAFGAQLGHRLQQVGQALQRHVGRRRGDQASRHAGDVRPRPEEVGVDADGHEAHALVVDAHVVVDVTDRVLADHDDARQPRSDPALHLDERVPPADREALAPVRARGPSPGGGPW